MAPGECDAGSHHISVEINCGNFSRVWQSILLKPGESTVTVLQSYSEVMNIPRTVGDTPAAPGMCNNLKLVFIS